MKTFNKRLCGLDIIAPDRYSFREKTDVSKIVFAFFQDHVYVIYRNKLK